MKDLQSNVILEAIEAEIVSGALPPGARLAEASLAKQYGVSRTPVREALQSLVSRSLAERLPFKGVIVCDFDDHHINDLFHAMGEIEALCGGYAAQNMSDAALAKIEEAHVAMSDLASQKSSRAYEELNNDFHSMVYEGAGNAHLTQIAFDLRLKLAPFRKSQLYEFERMQASNNEHALIVQLLKTRNVPGVQEALRVHLKGAATAVLRKRSTHAAST